MQVNYKEVYASTSRLKRYKIWLGEVCKHFEVSEEEVVAKQCLKPDVVSARHTFYWLCWKDRINLYRLSEHLGKNRSTISATISRAMHLRNKNVENLIYEKITSQERKEDSEKEIR